MKTGFLQDSHFMLHQSGPGHPECSERISNTMSYLEKQPWFDSLNKIDARHASHDEILSIHDAQYIRRAEEVCHSGLAFLDSMDVGVSIDSFEIALLAAGSALNMADEIFQGNIDNGFALMRPPGHHAEYGMAMGFCLFNNIAILSRYLQTKYGLNKIAIVDWDAHHGNGTQHLFEEDPSILYISMHQYPFYPGTGNYTETGSGKGKGSVLNCPMLAGSGNKDYEQVFINQVLPKIDAFKPECILISAGFDAHYADPLANINLTEDFFGWMTLRLMEKAAQHCNNRIISLLEGGYNLDALAKCVGIHLQELSQQK